MVTRNFYKAISHQLVVQNASSNMSNYKLDMIKTDGTKPDQYNTCSTLIRCDEGSLLRELARR